MLFLFTSLKTILSSKDISKIFSMSALLFLVALVEIFALFLISYLVLNLSDFSSGIYETSFFKFLLSLVNGNLVSANLALASLIVLYAILSTLFSLRVLKYVSITSQIIGSSIKLNIAKIFLYQSWKSALGEKNSEQTSKIINDGGELGILINFLMHLFSRSILACLIILGLCIFNFKLTTLMVFFLGTSYFFIFQTFKSRVDRNSLQVSKMKDRLINIVTNFLGSIKEIIFYGNQYEVIKDFHNANDIHAKGMGENYFLAQVPRFLIDTILLIILVIGAVVVNVMSFSAIDFFTTISIYGIASLKLLPAFQNIFNFAHEIYIRMPYLQNVIKIFAASNFNHSKGSYDSNRKLTINSLEFKDVSFSYNESSKPSSKKINVNIESGDRVAVIGPSGSGKSTFIDLLLGLLKPDSGKILINNTSLEDINEGDYRANFSYIPQKIFLTESSIFENIIFGSGRANLDESAFRKAIELSHSYEFINQAEFGQETLISDYQISFSGGQKQCLGFARAFYRGGEILIFDEATNAMDQKLEASILKSIKISDFNTLICITHRPSLLKEFNKICVFNAGSLEDIGTYDELIKRNTFFKEIISSSVNS